MLVFICGTQVLSLVSDYSSGVAEDAPMHHSWCAGDFCQSCYSVISVRWTMVGRRWACNFQSTVAEGWSSSHASVCACSVLLFTWLQSRQLCLTFPAVASHSLPQCHCLGSHLSTVKWTCSQVVILGPILLAFNTFSYHRSGASSAVSAEQLSPGAGPGMHWMHASIARENQTFLHLFNPYNHIKSKPMQSVVETLVLWGNKLWL